MKIGKFAVATGALALALASWNTPSKAQGPLWDRVNVNLPYSVSIGDRTLQPGEYVIQQLQSPAGSSRVLLIYSDNGMKFQTSAMTIPALDPNTARDTKVVLHHFGPDYYFDKIWIQGKDYGYEFPLPDSVKQREKERMEPVSVAANYQSVPADTETATTTTTTTTTAAATQSTTQPQTTTGAQTTIGAQTDTGARTTTGAQTTMQAQTTQPQTTTQSQTTMQAQTTQSQTTMTPQTTQPATTSRSTVQSATTTASTDNNSANREMQDNTATTTRQTMPATSAGWLMMLLSGGALSGAGLRLRRKR